MKISMSTIFHFVLRFNLKQWKNTEIQHHSLAEGISLRLVMFPHQLEIFVDRYDTAPVILYINPQLLAFSRSPTHHLLDFMSVDPVI